MGRPCPLSAGRFGCYKKDSVAQIRAGALMRCSKCGTKDPSTSSLLFEVRGFAGQTLPEMLGRKAADIRLLPQVRCSIDDGCGRSYRHFLAARVGLTKFVGRERDSSFRLRTFGSSRIKGFGEPSTLKKCAIFDSALKLIIDATHRYDGYILQSTGDGIEGSLGSGRSGHAAAVVHDRPMHCAMPARGRMIAAPAGQRISRR